MTKRLFRTGNCYRCGYVWRLRKRVPRICARCKSPKFNVPKIRLPRYGGGEGIREILDPVRSQITRLASRHGATLAVFGSVARSTATPSSDVDLLVEWEGSADLLRHVRLRAELEKVLRRRVDLETEDSLKWLIQPQVLREMIPL